jgi:hypothetical protein
MQDVRAMRSELGGTPQVEVLLLVDRAPGYSKDSRALGADFLVAAAPVSSSWPHMEISGGLGARLDWAQQNSEVFDAAAMASYLTDELRSQIEEGRYQWCFDGAIPGNGAVENWFELMDAWFDDPKGMHSGGANGYSW